MSTSNPYSAWRRCGDEYCISEQLPREPMAGECPAGIGEQSIAALHNVRRVAQQFGCRRKDAIQATVNSRTFDDFELMDAKCAVLPRDSYPVRSAITVSGLLPGADVKNEAIVAKNKLGANHEHNRIRRSPETTLVWQK